MRAAGIDPGLLKFGVVVAEGFEGVTWGEVVRRRLWVRSVWRGRRC